VTTHTEDIEAFRNMTPQEIVLSDEAYDAFMLMLETEPSDCPGLVKLMTERRTIDLSGL
jgi:uncharacterized protein (DUF1778 family)